MGRESFGEICVNQPTNISNLLKHNYYPSNFMEFGEKMKYERSGKTQTILF